MNKVYLEGNVGSILFDNEKEQSSAFLVISLGCNGSYYDKANNLITSTTWVKVVIVGKTAHFLRENIKVGARLVVVGALENNNYKDKEQRDIYELNVKATRVMQLVK